MKCMIKHDLIKMNIKTYQMDLIAKITQGLTLDKKIMLFITPDKLHNNIVQK